MAYPTYFALNNLNKVSSDMKLGNHKIPLYWNSDKNCEVIKVASCGDNFGYVQNIQTLEEFKTYGYNTMPKVGDIEVCVSVTENS